MCAGYLVTVGQDDKRIPARRSCSSPPMVARVMAHPLSSNPLFVRTLAEELRVFGVHEELEARLGECLTSVTVDDLFERVLERVEQDCGTRKVRDALTAPVN